MTDPDLAKNLRLLPENWQPLLEWFVCPACLTTIKAPTMEEAHEILDFHAKAMHPEIRTDLKNWKKSVV